jgi:diacylglycerol kinase (ATP)
MSAFITRRLESFGHAFRGMKTLLRSETNAKIHAASAVIAIGSGIWVRLSVLEWCAIAVAVTMVFAAEALNTALEFLADAAIPETEPLVKKSKDVAAAAVLIASLGAAVIGILVLGPHMLQKITG